MTDRRTAGARLDRLAMTTLVFGLLIWPALRSAVRALESVTFVMKGGQTYKNDYAK